MAQFTGKKIDITKINGGQEIADGSGVTPELLNAPVNSALYTEKAIDTLTSQVDTSEIDGSGTPSVSFVETINGQETYKYLKFKNLKGAKGEQGKEGKQGRSVKKLVQSGADLIVEYDDGTSQTMVGAIQALTELPIVSVDDFGKILVVNQDGKWAVGDAPEGGGGGGITDVQVNGTSVVADGVANIPEASATQAGVVTTGSQTFAGVKNIISDNTNSGQKVMLSLKPNTPTSNRAYSAMRFETVTKDGTSYPYVVGVSSLNAFTFKSNFSYSGNYYNFENYAGQKFTIHLNTGGYDGGQVNCGSIDKQLYLQSQGSYSAVPTYAGTLMSAPSTWSTGTSGSATLPVGGGLFEIVAEVYLRNTAGGEEFARKFSFLVNWDGSSKTESASSVVVIYSSTAGSGSSNSYRQYRIQIGEDGLIYLKGSTLGAALATELTYEANISYRKIGIA